LNKDNPFTPAKNRQSTDYIGMSINYVGRSMTGLHEIEDC